MSFDANSGVLSGTPTVDGTYGPITITATNGVSPDAVQTFSIDVGVPPQFSSTPVTAGTVGSSYTYTATASGTPAPTLLASGVPAWLTFDANSGVLTGTPPAEGTYGPINIAATNGVSPDAVQTFSIDVSSPSGSGSSSGSGGGCSATVRTWGLPLGLILALAVPAAVRLRRRVG